MSKDTQGNQNTFWKDLCSILNVELYCLISEFSPLAEALFTMGIPTSSIRQYEIEIKSGAILLIINSKRDEVEHGCEVLHNEKQRATVHLA